MVDWLLSSSSKTGHKPERPWNHDLSRAATPAAERGAGSALTPVENGHEPAEPAERSRARRRHRAVQGDFLWLFKGSPRLETLGLRVG